MPGYLLNASSIVQCSHMGKAQPDMPSPRVKVMGQAAVLVTSPYSVTGCTFPPPPNGNGPCVKALFTVAALRVKSMGMALLLADSKASCTPTGTPLTVVFAQPRVKGI